MSLRTCRELASLARTNKGVGAGATSNKSLTPRVSGE